MAKYKVKIERVETYSMVVVVDANSPDEAILNVSDRWNKDDYLYEKLVDNYDDSDTKFLKQGLADEKDQIMFINI